jgi:hypothetical protein
VLDGSLVVAIHLLRLLKSVWVIVLARLRLIHLRLIDESGTGWVFNQRLNFVKDALNIIYATKAPVCSCLIGALKAIWSEIGPPHNDWNVLQLRMTAAVSTKVDPVIKAGERAFCDNDLGRVLEQVIICQRDGIVILKLVNVLLTDKLEQQRHLMIVVPNKTYRWVCRLHTAHRSFDTAMDGSVAYYQAPSWLGV